jgi:hypothetical protein
MAGGGSSGSAGTPPPAMLQGTIAFVDQSATFSWTFSPTARDAGAKAIHDISGTIRYGGVTFSHSGMYDSATAAISISTSAQTVASRQVMFTILGTYVVGRGFTGTVQRSIDGVPDANKGSIAAAETTSATASSVKNYLGTYGGMSRGTWNMTLKNGVATGTYTGEIRGSYSSGTLTGTLSGSVLTLTATETSVGTWTGGGSGTLSGTTMKGTWNSTNGSMVASGFWSGAEATANGDAVPPSSGDPVDYKYNAVMQTVDTAFRSVDFTTGGGPTFWNSNNTVSATIAPNTPTAGKNTVTFSIVPGGYTDSVTGIKVNGSATYIYVGIGATAFCESMNGSLTFTGACMSTLAFAITVNPANNAATGTATVDGTLYPISY